MGRPAPATRLHAAAAALAAQARRRATAAVYPAVPSGWRNNPSQLQRSDLSSGPGGAVSVGYRFDRTGTLEALEVDGDPLTGLRLWRCTPDLVDLEVDGIRRRYEVHLLDTTAWVDSPSATPAPRPPSGPSGGRQRRVGFERPG